MAMKLLSLCVFLPAATRSSEGLLVLLLKAMIFLDFCLIWPLGGFGSMENDPTGCGSDLLAILRFFKKCAQIEKCQECIPAAGIGPKK